MRIRKQIYYHSNCHQTPTKDSANVDLFFFLGWGSYTRSALQVLHVLFFCPDSLFAKKGGVRLSKMGSGNPGLQDHFLRLRVVATLSKANPRTTLTSSWPNGNPPVESDVGTDGCCRKCIYQSFLQRHQCNWWTRHCRAGLQAPDNLWIYSWNTTQEAINVFDCSHVI